jgi:tetratricopeptide (TPR) repeat protein
MEGYYADWCLFHREQLRERYLNLLEALAKAYQAAGRFAEAVQCCRQLLHADPLREDAHYCLIQAYISLDRRSEARSQYIAYENTWRSEFGLQPSMRMQMVRRQLWDSQVDAAVERVVLRRPTLSQAVCPEAASLHYLQTFANQAEATTQVNGTAELRQRLWQHVADDAAQLGIALMQQALCQEALAYFDLALDALKHFPACDGQRIREVAIQLARNHCLGK